MAIVATYVATAAAADRHFLPHFFGRFAFSSDGMQHHVQTLIHTRGATAFVGVVGHSLGAFLQSPKELYTTNSLHFAVAADCSI